MRIHSNPWWNSHDIFFKVSARNHRFQFPLKVFYYLCLFFCIKSKRGKQLNYLIVFIHINIMDQWQKGRVKSPVKPEKMLKLTISFFKNNIKKSFNFCENLFKAIVEFSRIFFQCFS